jgi:hypothetical protein
MASRRLVWMLSDRDAMVGDGDEAGGVQLQSRSNLHKTLERTAAFDSTEARLRRYPFEIATDALLAA